MAAISVSLPLRVVVSLTARATREDKTVSKIVLDALEAYLDDESPC